MAVPLAPAPTRTIPGVQPDYGALILADPGYQAAKSAHDLTINTAGASRRAAARALAMNYGGLPAGFSDPYGDLTPDILSQAQANPESQLARLKTGYDAAQQQMQTGLAARGALHSGDLVYGQSNLDAGLASNQYDAGQAFGQAFGSQAIDPYNAASTGAEQSLASAVQTAGQTEAGLHPATPDQTASLLPNWQSDYGRPMYATTDGSWYTPDPSTGQLVLYAYPSGNDPTVDSGMIYTGV